MSFTEFSWGAHGTNPPTALKNQGFTAGYKPPAEYFNWLFYTIASCIGELQTASGATDGDVADLETAVGNLETAVEGIGADTDSRIATAITRAKKVYGLPLSVSFDANGVPLKWTVSTTVSKNLLYSENATTVFIASTVTEISGGCFSGWENLTDVYLDRDNSLTIGESAFGSGVTPHYNASFNANKMFAMAIAYIYAQLSGYVTTETYNRLVSAVNGNTSDIGDILEHSYFDGFTVTGNSLQMLSNGEPVGDPIPLGTDEEAGVSFDTGYIDENGYMHLTKDGEDIDDFTPFFVGTGGSGSASGSKVTFSLTSPLSFSVADTSGVANVSFNFASVDTETDLPTGDGTVQVYVNDVLKGSQTATQGANTINTFSYLASGTNAVKLTITDAYGVSTTRKCTITVESISIDWSLESTQLNTGNLNFTITPSGVGEKTLHVIVDGTDTTQTVTTSGYRISKRITGLTSGEHIIKAYCTSSVNGSTISSEVLVAAICQVENDYEVVAASSYVEQSVTQFTNIAMKYRVADPVNNPTDIVFLVNNVPYSEERVDQSEHVFNYRATTAGTLTIAITCDGVTVLTRTITVNALSIPVDEITASLALKFDPNAMVANDYFMNGGTRVNLTLSSGFDTINGGLQTDGDGNRAFVVKKGDRATIPYELFGDDGRRNGKEIKLIYKVDNCSDYDATAISCMNSDIGLKVRANDLKLQSELATAELQTCEGLRSEVDINIEPDSANRLVRIYEGGSQASITQYSDTDNFTQSSAQGITIGSDDCDVYVYLIRAYTSPLESAEILSNFIFDGADGQVITDRYNSSQIYDTSSGRPVVSPERVAAVNPNLHVLVWHAPAFSTSKSNKVNGLLSHVRTAGGITDSWSVAAIDKLQGTSSVDYIMAAGNHDFQFTADIDVSDGTTRSGYAMSSASKAVSYFNFKANVASSEHVNNILLAEWFNRYQPYTRHAKEIDNKVRDTVEGQMAALFFHNTSNSVVTVGSVEVQPDETVFYSLGCLNNSKKNTEVFGQNSDDDVACIEVKNNTSALARFKSDDLTNENFDGEGTYEWRYLDDSVTEAAMIEKWQELLSFVVACDASNAQPDRVLDEAVTYEGHRYVKDTADYRRAKWKAEFGDHFIADTIWYHQLFTLFFCMPDNRGKNLFWAYSKREDKWHLCFGYDFDTAMGNDNVGGLTLRYGYLDSDIIGTKNVFNAADSTVFVMNWEVFTPELRSMYTDLENEGCWTMDGVNGFGTLCREYQLQACVALWIEDFKNKYENPLILKNNGAFLDMGCGTKWLQRSQFLKFQPQFISSYMLSGYCKVKKGELRGYTPTNYAGVSPANRMTITPYVNTFIYVEVAQQRVKHVVVNGVKSEVPYIRAYAGVPITIAFDEVGSMNDTEIDIYNANFLQDIGELACLYSGRFDISAFERLKYARIGSSNAEYINTNLQRLTLTNCKSLEYLNLEGCQLTADDKTVDLTANVALREVYTRRSNITGVVFANGGRVTTAYLNEIRSLSAKNLIHLSTLSIASYTNLTSLIVEGCPTIDTLTIVQTAANLNRLRLIDVDWELQTARLLVQLATYGGYDDDGYNTAVAVITGVCEVTQISEARYNALNTAFPKLTIDTDTENFVASYTVKFYDEDGTTLLDTQVVESGEDAENPITRVFNPIPIPTKASTVDTIYSFGGWDKTFTSIASNLKVSAIYTSQTRTYTVRFYDGSELLQTSTVEAHGSAFYNEVLSKEGYLWTGFSVSTTNVTSDIDTYAVYEQPALPEYVKDLSQFTYLYSEDPADAEVSAYTMGQIYKICQEGLASTYFSVGAELKLLPSSGSTVADSMFVFQVFGFNHFPLASDGTKFANAVFGMKGVLNANRAMNSSHTNSGGFPASAMATWLNETMVTNFSLPWQALFKTVTVLSSRGATSDVIVSKNCKLFLFSTAEVFSSYANTTPYNGEVDANAATKTFPIFTDNNSRIKKHYNGTGSAEWWWLRSPTPTNSSNFDLANNYGTYNASGTAGIAYGVCFGFCI